MSNIELQPAVSPELIQGIFQAREVLTRPTSPVLKTEFIYDEDLSRQYSADIWLVSELHQPIGAYKLRGAENFVQNLPVEELQHGVVTASTGNHGRAVAYVTRRLRIPSYIFMPTTTPQQKIEGVKRTGSDMTRVVLTGQTFDEAEEAAYGYCQTSGAVFAHPFNDREVIAGQGTLGLEIAEALPSLDFVFCPIGGGGLVAGVANALRYHNSRVEIVGVEPAGAASMQAARSHGSPVSIEGEIDTFADGAAVRKVGEIPFAAASVLLNHVFSATNLEIREAVTYLWERSPALPVETAAAMALVGLKRRREDIKGKSGALILSGGNLSRERYEAEVRLG